MGPDRVPPILVNTIEELLERKIAAPVWKTEITAIWDQSR
jgi:hypothetical protein